MFLNQITLLTLAVFRRKIRLGLFALLRHPMGHTLISIFDQISIFDDVRRIYFDTDLTWRHVTTRRIVTASNRTTVIVKNDFPPHINRIYNFFRKTWALLLSGNRRSYDISLICIVNNVCGLTIFIWNFSTDNWRPAVWIEFNFLSRLQWFNFSRFGRLWTA